MFIYLCFCYQGFFIHFFAHSLFPHPATESPDTCIGHAALTFDIWFWQTQNARAACCLLGKVNLVFLRIKYIIRLVGTLIYVS